MENTIVKGIRGIYLYDYPSGFGVEIKGGTSIKTTINDNSDNNDLIVGTAKMGYTPSISTINVEFSVLKIDEKILELQGYELIDGYWFRNNKKPYFSLGYYNYEEDSEENQYFNSYWVNKLRITGIEENETTYNGNSYKEYKIKATGETDNISANSYKEGIGNDLTLKRFPVNIPEETVKNEMIYNIPR